jgi:uncharacterized surface protein with fasciclin (FAS1) repeats
LKELDAVLEYHVVVGTAAFVKDLTDGEKIKTLQGYDVLIKINSAIMINDAIAIVTCMQWRWIDEVVDGLIWIH